MDLMEFQLYLDLKIWFTSTVAVCKPAVQKDASPRIVSSPVPATSCPFVLSKFRIFPLNYFVKDIYWLIRTTHYIQYKVLLYVRSMCDIFNNGKRNCSRV